MDTAGFDAFYDRTAADVARHVYLLTASPHRAEHVTHRAYARAFAEWDTVGTLPDPAAWVRMLASDLALDHLHRGRHRIGGWIPHADGIARKVRRDGPGRPDSPETPDEFDKSDESDESAEEIPAPTADATESAVPDLTGDTDAAAAADLSWSADVALLRALRRLPARRRRAVVLRHHLGMSPEEVAVETEATTGTTIDRISRGNYQLARRVGELTGPDPDSPEAHERLHAVMADLSGRYRPKLRPAPALRAGARARTGVLVGVVAAAVLALGGFAIASMASPGKLADERAQVQRSLAARAAAGDPLVADATARPRDFRFGHTTARAQDVPDGMFELVTIQSAADHDGGTFLTIGTARVGPDSAGVPPLREVPLAQLVTIRGEKSFGNREPTLVDPPKFLDKLAQGGLAKATFQLHYDDEAQVDKITEYSR